MHFLRLAAVAALVTVAVACTDATAPELSDAQANDAELVTGQQIYKDKCARCHGDAGGGGAGPKLADGSVVDDFPDPEAQVEVIRNGRGSMPAWEGELTDAEIDAVVRYTREVL